MGSGRRPPRLPTRAHGPACRPRWFLISTPNRQIFLAACGGERSGDLIDSHTRPGPSTRPEPVEEVPRAREVPMGDIEELVDLVLTGQHPSLRERCLFDRIMSVLEDTFGGVRRCWRSCCACGPTRRGLEVYLYGQKIPRLRCAPLRITALRPPALILNISS